MSVSSVICIKETDCYKCAYCGSDSEPSHNGFILSNFYNSKEKAEALIDFGSFLFIEADINNETIENYRESALGITEPEKIKSIKKIIDMFWLCSYVYIFYKNKWHYGFWQDIKEGKKLIPINSKTYVSN